jgi:hypothetical protein
MIHVQHILAFHIHRSFIKFSNSLTENHHKVHGILCGEKVKNINSNTSYPKQNTKPKLTQDDPPNRHYWKRTRWSWANFHIVNDLLISCLPNYPNTREPNHAHVLFKVTALPNRFSYWSKCALMCPYKMPSIFQADFPATLTDTPPNFNQEFVFYEDYPL